MNKFERTVIALVVVVLLAGGWFFRWEITPIKGGQAIGGAFLLDRWTGSLYWLREDEKVEVKPPVKQ